MTPTDLRAAMPALDEVVYLNTGASGPSPTNVVEAVEGFLEYHEYDAPAGEGMYPAAFDSFEETREVVAEFLGGTPEGVALTQSTTDGINRVATALDWESDATVVRTDLEHPAGILPWQRLRDLRGVGIEVLETERGRLDLDDVKDAVGPGDLVCLSAVTWNYGTRLPVGDIVDVAHDAGARVLVDAVQAPGQMPVDVTEWGADFVAGAGHKWLLGPWGAGFLHVSEDALPALEPRSIGYRGVVEPTADEYEFKPGAAQLEIGTTSPATYAGLREAIETITDLGLATIESRIADLTAQFKDGLADDRLLSPREYESGLVTVQVEDAEATVERLAEDGVVVRSLPYPEGSVRVSLHAFNTPADVDAVLDALDRSG